jgi:septin family protein
LHAYRTTVRESGVSLDVEIIEAVGFGEFGHRDCLEELVDFVHSRHRKHFDQEMHLDRGSNQEQGDELIHAALLCFHPRITTGLTEREMTLLARLSPSTCVIPLITRADVYTPQELQCLKTTVQGQMQKARLEAYLPTACEGHSQTRIAMLKSIQVREEVMLMMWPGSHALGSLRINLHTRDRTCPLSRSTVSMGPCGW